jgi:hypothetical protein
MTNNPKKMPHSSKKRRGKQPLTPRGPALEPGLAKARTTGRRIDASLPAIVVLFLLFWLAFSGLGVFSPMRQRVVGVDPVGYYAWLRSAAFDHDLQFENEYRVLNAGVLIPGDTLVRPDGLRTATGHLPNAFSIGPALLWAPFLAGAHGALAWAHGALAGTHGAALLTGAPADGFSRPYHSAIFFANMFYGMMGTVLTYFAVRTWFPARVAAIAAIAAWACSPALYYTYAQEAMSHAGSFFASALFLLAWARWRQEEAYWRWALIGGALGLVTLVRWQDVALALIPTVDLLWSPKPLSTPKQDWLRRGAKLAVCAGATVAVFLPQLIGWKILYGSFLTIPQGSDFIQWGRPRMVDLLFSTRYGLVTWTPWCALGLIGLFSGPKTLQRPVFLSLSIALLIHMYVGACAGNMGWSFGMRRMVGCMPILATGFAAAAMRLNTPWRRKAALTIVLTLACWNFLFVVQYGGFLDPFYAHRALGELASEYNLDPPALLTLRQLPDGQPFDARAFVYAHRFPRDSSPTFAQLVTDKLLVLWMIPQRLLNSAI